MKIYCRKKPGERFEELIEGYLISNYGRVYSLNRKKILKEFKNNSGYSRVQLRTNGITKNVFIHIKVVEIFGDCNGNKLPPGNSLRSHHLSIDHIDGNKKHNQQFNLELVTHSENCIRRNRMVSQNV